MRVTKILRAVAEFLAQRKGLPVLIGVGLIALNLVVRFLPGWSVTRWFASTDVLLHLGLILGLLGMLLGDAL